MFVVYKKKEISSKNSPKKSKIFSNIPFSPLIKTEKPIINTNSFPFVTNNSFDSGKSLTNFFQNDQTALSTPIKNDFLSKKTKFHIDIIDKSTDKKKKKKNYTTENNSTKTNNSNRIIIPTTEEDIKEGRWETDEHIRFIEAINNYGNDWKEVQKYVGTRSSNQVRSHAQKFFLKLKTFSDPSLGIDFTLDSVKNLSSILNIVKDLEGENKCVNMLYVINEKLSNHNVRINNGIANQNQNKNVIVENNKIIINKESINENSNFNEFIVKKEKFKNISFNKNEKKIVKFCKIKKNKKIRIKNINEDNKNDNIIVKEIKEYIENKEEPNTIIKNGEIFDEIDDCKNSIFEDYNEDNDSNQIEYETNERNSFSFSNCIKEIKTISLINGKYYS